MDERNKEYHRRHARIELDLFAGREGVKKAAMTLVETMVELDITADEIDAVAHLFRRLACCDHVTRLTSKPEEWFSYDEDGKTVHQSRRNPSAFSLDGLKTYVLNGKRYRLHSTHDEWKHFESQDLIDTPPVPPARPLKKI